MVRQIHYHLKRLPQRENQTDSSRSTPSEGKEAVKSRVTYQDSE